jgi:uncharacterized protein YndB with AHSA1/START domain
MVVESIEIARRPEDVFAYVSQVDRHPEWQDNLVSSEWQSEGPPQAGMRIVQVRRLPGGRRRFTLELTEYDPPRRMAIRGLDGPMRPVGNITIEPVADGSGSRLTQRLDLQGHGLLGKLIAPLARRDAAKRVPRYQARLKGLLERGA